MISEMVQDVVNFSRRNKSIFWVLQGYIDERKLRLRVEATPQAGVAVSRYELFYPVASFVRREL